MAGKERYIRGVCKTCGETLRVRIGDMDTNQARDTLRKIRPYECPGGGLTPHQELGDMLSGYDWDFTPFEDEAPMTDADYIDRLQGVGYTVLSGRRGNHPELPNLHDIPGLRHAGFGDFEDDSHYYERADSPTGTRFYIQREKRRG